MNDENEKNYRDTLKKAVNKIEELSSQLGSVNEDIAIIGLGCRFPGGANNPDKYWDILINGVDTVTQISVDRFDCNEFYSSDPDELGKMNTKNGAFLTENIKEFDNRHFEISPLEAKAMDPQQRLLLEVSWEALEDAGQDIKGLRESNTGIFIGMNSSDYHRAHMYSRDLEKIDAYSATGVAFSAASGRLSYFYDFKGPSETIDTACSSSLVAMKAAMDSLRNNGCDMALVGGVNLLLSPESFIGLSKIHGLSADGRCKAFDESADGFGRGEGCGVIVLKKVSNARRDSDSIQALIKAIEVGQDGRTNGITAPNASSQKTVILSALKSAGLHSENIDYVETHGTGTPLGDTIEAQVLNEIFHNRKEKLQIGSVKSNIAHLEGASAMAGIIKIVLAMKHGQIPPSIHVKKPNSKISWDNIEVVKNKVIWDSQHTLKRAGISAFGFTGTLAHAILEEYSKETTIKKELPHFLLSLSANSKEAMLESIQDMTGYIAESKESLHSICYTSNRKKSFMEHRFYVTGKDREEILHRLTNSDIIQENTSVVRYNKKKIVYLFTGQGSIYDTVSKELYQFSSVFKDAMDFCNNRFLLLLNISIIEWLYGGEELNLGEIGVFSQPIIFSIEYAITKVWDSLGVRPDIIMGHSIGEFAAALYAGMISFEDATKMIACRCRLMEDSTICGKMTGILAEEALVRETIEDGKFKKVSIAAINAPQNVTISGIEVEVDQVVKMVQKKKPVFIEHLSITHPFHSILMEECVNSYIEMTGPIKTLKKKINYISTITGVLEDEKLLGNCNYWGHQLHSTVNFQKAIKTAEGMGGKVFIEIGGDATLCGLSAQCLNDEDHMFLPTLRKGVGNFRQLLESMGSLYLQGISLDWNTFYKGFSNKAVFLPTYPFQKNELWMSITNKQLHSDEEAVQFVEVKEVATTKSSPQRVEKELKDIINVITGLRPEEINSGDNIFTLGFDSLILLNFKKKIDKKYKIDISLNEIYITLNSVASIAEHIYKYGESSTMIEVNHGKAIKSNDDTLSDIQTKIDEISAQLGSMITGNSNPTSPTERVNFPKTNNNAMIFEEDILSSKQKLFIATFVEKYNKKTFKSKEYARSHSKAFSDWINSLNFRQSIKHVQYPIVAARSKGPKFWDIDNNEYLDLALGYGVHYFGHNPDFIREAIERQLLLGIELGPQNRLAGKVAEMICEMTGAERVTFCNTGTEAVMVALKLSRLHRKKNLIVKFSGSYHGSFDGILSNTDEDGSYPTSPGVTYGTIKDTVTLLYGSGESLEYIRKHSDIIAAVLVEPVQSRKPGYHPYEFLKDLRDITTEQGIVLIFDEMVNGFRINIGGAQAHFSIRADLVTYGKIIGGGLPIGIVAGRKELIDGVDGGSWDCMDQSLPDHETIMFAGTFCKNPLSMAASYAVLSYLKENGNNIQEEVNAKTAVFAKKANMYFEQEHVPVQVTFFGSQFRFESYGKYDLSFLPIEMELFFYLLNYKGIYTWERRTCCFCTEISYAEIDFIVDKIKESIEELRAGGFTFIETKQVREEDIAAKLLPMSFHQKRLYSNILVEQNDLYHIIGAMMINGKPNLAKLEAVIKIIIGRHDTLRSKLFIHDEEYMQETVMDADFKIDTIRYEMDISIDEMITENINSFELSKGNLLKVKFLEYPKGQLLLFDLHHTVADGRSLDILGKEIIELYEGKVLPPLFKQYSDYVEWELDYQNSPKLLSAELYWKTKLGNGIEKVDLPFSDINQNDSIVNEGNTLWINIGRDKVSKLKVAIKESRSTIFSYLFSVFNIFLYKMSGNTEIATAIPVSNRVNGEFEQNIGMFTNTLILKNEINPEMNFTKLLSDITFNALDAYSHLEYPFHMLVHNITRTANQVNVMFIYENMDQRVIKLDDLEIEMFHYKPKVAEFDLTFEILEVNGEFNINLNYKTALYSEDEVKQWGEKYEKILDYTLADFNMSIINMDLLSEREKEKILYDFNHTSKKYEKEIPLHKQIELQAAENPMHTAVICDNQKMTYQELNNRANQIARKIHMETHGKNQIVAIMVERSLEMIAGIVGILKAGAAYLPIDLKLPNERKRFMLEDSKVDIILTTESDSELWGDKYKVFMLGDLRSEDDNRDLSLDIDGSHMAYLLYTSGSTGNPKGVMVEHRQVNNFILGMKESTGLNRYQNILCMTTISFDIFGLESLLPLVNGMCIILAKEEESLDANKLAEMIEVCKVEIVQATPSRMQMLMESDRFHKALQGIRMLLIGGEAFPRNLIPQLAGYKKLEVYNVYGPTETTIWSTCKRVEGDCYLSIGKPISNTQIYILDSRMQIVPIGVSGELFIAGDGVARGYINRKELSEEKFIDNPFGEGRIYRTGDMAKWLPNGEIHLYGRMDDQVKIRGYRIELGEIEAKLTLYKSIHKVAVVVKEDPRMEKFICAYFISDEIIHIQDLRSYAKCVLPDYMVPKYFMRIDSIPLNTSGKVDRKLLPDMQLEIVSENYGKPNNKIQEQLVEIWKDLFSLEAVGVNDDFFDLGGHSLNAAILAGRVYKIFHVQIPVKDILQLGNIKELGQMIELGIQSEYISIPKASQKTYYEASPAQSRIFISQGLENNTAYNMTKTIKVKGNLDFIQLEKSIKQIINRHESLRTSFSIVGDSVVQTIHKMEDISFQLEEVDYQEGMSLRNQIKAFISPFNLSNCPLIRVGILKDSANEFIVILDVPHIIADGESAHILTTELSLLYNKHILKSVDMQYKDFSEWHILNKKSKGYKTQEDFWKNEFKEDYTKNIFPTDYSMENLKNFDGEKVRITLGSKTTDKLKELSKTSNGSLYTILLSELEILLAKYTRYSEITIGTVGAGRTHPDLESVIGMFVNTLALKCKVLENQSFIEFHNVLKEKVYTILENQEYPIEELISHMERKRNCGRNPLFDIMFTFQNNNNDFISFDGLGIEEYEVDNRAEKFIMTIICYEKENEIIVDFNYSKEIFKRESIEKFSGYFQYVINQTLNNPDILIRDIYLETEDQLSAYYESASTVSEEDLKFSF